MTTCRRHGEYEGHHCGPCHEADRVMIQRAKHLDALSARVVEAAVARRRHGFHSTGCDTWENGPCSCGHTVLNADVDDLLAAREGR